MWAMPDAYAERMELRSKSLSTTDGLPSNTVRRIFQDSKGFLWFGTTNGLSRYDGSTFLNFQSDIGSTDLSLAHNNINNLQEGPYEFLWIGTTNRKFSCYDLQRGCFVNLNMKEDERPNTFFQAPDSTIWLWSTATETVVRRVVCNANRQVSSTIFSHRQGKLPNPWVRFVVQDAKGKTWIGTKSGVSVYENGKIRVIDRHVNTYGACVHQGVVYIMSRDGNVYIWKGNKMERLASLPISAEGLKYTGHLALPDRWYIFTGKGTFEFHFDSHKMVRSERLAINNGEVKTDDRGDYWVYNKTGHVWYIEAQTGKMREFDLFPKEKVSLVDYERYRIVHDDNDVLWISTYGNGLFAYDLVTEELHHFTAGKEKRNPLNSDFLSYLEVDNAGGIWVSAERVGLQRLTVTNQGVEHIIPQEQTISNRANTVRLLMPTPDSTMLIGTGDGKLYEYSTGKQLREVDQLPIKGYAALTDNDGNLCIGTRGAGLKIGNTWYKYNDADSTSLSGNNVFSLLRDNKGRLWVGTLYTGLNLAIRATDGKYTFRHFISDNVGLKDIRALQQDGNGIIWEGTSDGVYLIHPDSLIAGKEGRHYSLTNHKFCGNEIRILLPEGDNQMWVGTCGGGFALCTYSPKEDKFTYKQFTQADGLVHNMVQSILRDERGRLWIATEYGMSRFDPENCSFDNYYFSAYLQSNAYSESTAAVGPKGHLYFGTDYGVTIINPRKITDNTPTTHATITGLYINGTPVSPMTKDSPLSRDIAYSDQVTLEHYQNSLILSFSELNYNDNGQSHYRYWLENYDKTWNEGSDQDFASYKYLKPGHYRFHVMPYDYANRWKGEETVLDITIRPPFWESNVAIALYLLLLIVALWFTFRIVGKFNTLRTQMKVEKQLTEYKLVFFTNISHEFRTPLTLIRASLEKMSSVSGMPPEAHRLLQTLTRSTDRMLRLVNQLLIFRKLQNNKLKLALEETDVMKFLGDICQNFNDLAEQKQMNFEFRPSTPSYRMFIDRESLDKVVYNLLSNAFKYTPSGGHIQLVATVDEASKQLKIEAIDNGVGIPQEKRDQLFKRFMQVNFSRESIGVGLHLTYELVLLHKGTIVYSENPTGGSIFTVTLPTDPAVHDEADFVEVKEVDTSEDKASVTEDSFTIEQQEALKKEIGPLNRHKILIIEDDADVRRFLQEEIGTYFQVEIAEDGLSGLQKAQECDPNLVVCDVMMPGMNGFEVTKKLKHDFATSHIPIILLTALSSIEKQTEGIDSGADAYIAKPFSTKFLITRIFRLIEQREKLREKYTSEPGMVHTAMYTTDRDREFTEKMEKVIETNMTNADFTIDDFAQQMQLSRTMFYKKIKGLTGYSPVEYLRIVRMKKGAELLLSQENLTVAEVSYKVGINDPFYFSKCFKAQFGVSPSVFQKGGKQQEDSASGETK